jgi:hypothetical protein
MTQGEWNWAECRLDYISNSLSKQNFVGLLFRLEKTAANAGGTTWFRDPEVAGSKPVRRE